MEYIVSFRPSRILTDMVLKKEGTIVPNSGLHGTICHFYMDPLKEKDLVEDLSQVPFDPFEVKTTGYDFFDKKSFVLTLTQPKELIDLHNRIIPIVERHTVGFEEILGEYSENMYAPHIIISNKQLKQSRVLIGIKIKVNSYLLERKRAEWAKVREFR